MEVKGIFDKSKLTLAELCLVFFINKYKALILPPMNINYLILIR